MPFVDQSSCVLQVTNLVDKEKESVDRWWDMIFPMDIDHVADPPKRYTDLATPLYTKPDFFSLLRFWVESDEDGKEGLLYGREAFCSPMSVHQRKVRKNHTWAKVFQIFTQIPFGRLVLVGGEKGFFGLGFEKGAP